MTEMTRKIDMVKMLDKKINVWSHVANLAEKVIRYADVRRRVYMCERGVIINEMNVDIEAIDIEVKKEYNRRNLNFEIEL